MGQAVPNAVPQRIKMLFLNVKKPRPLWLPLALHKALFLLAKTGIANSCMTCVKILRAIDPTNTISQNPRTRKPHLSPAKLVVALVCFLMSPTVMRWEWSTALRWQRLALISRWISLRLSCAQIGDVTGFPEARHDLVNRLCPTLDVAPIKQDMRPQRHEPSYVGCDLQR